MAIHKLVLDEFFEDLNFILIGIHCAIEDYRLGYLLNSYLNIGLKRKQNDLDYNNGSTYSIFEWIDEKQLITWNLVSNICKKEQTNKADSNSLFPEQENILRTDYLIPEHKKVNYFLKIDDDSSLTHKKRIVNDIQKIPQIVTAYTINPDELKSKANLIFD